MFEYYNDDDCDDNILQVVVICFALVSHMAYAAAYSNTRWIEMICHTSYATVFLHDFFVVLRVRTKDVGILSCLVLHVSAQLSATAYSNTRWMEVSWHKWHATVFLHNSCCCCCSARRHVVCNSFSSSFLCRLACKSNLFWHFIALGFALVSTIVRRSLFKHKCNWSELTHIARNSFSS